MGAKRVLLIVFGSLIGLVGLALTVAGIVGLIAYGTGRDDDGFFTTDTERFASRGYALVSDEVDLGSEGDSIGDLDLGDLAELRVRAERADGGAVFVGIGRRADVDGYLGDVRRDLIRDVEFDPFEADYRRLPGGAPRTRPAAQDIWVAQAAGPGRQQIEWDLEGGEWLLVVMNADASAPVVADLEAGVRIKILLGLAVGVLIGGIVILTVGLLMLIFGIKAGPPGDRPPPAVAGGPGDAPPPPPPPRHASPY